MISFGHVEIANSSASCSDKPPVLNLSEQEALELAISTWPKDIKPIVHYSESKALHESNDKVKPQAHSDYINELPNLYGNDVDVMVEAKAKELSILPFI